jgi:hypothetical protein
MANEADDLVNTIKSSWKKAYDLANKVPWKKQEYTDMHAKRVDEANESFRKEGGRKKLTPEGPKLGSKKKTAKKTRKETARKRN